VKKGNLIVGIDIGTTKTCVVVGEVNPLKTLEGSYLSETGIDIEIDIIGVGRTPSSGIKKGVVVNIEETAESIRRAVKEAESVTGIEIEAVYVNIAGDHICNFPSHGIVAVREREINQREVDRVIDAARTVAVPLDREMLHVFPMGFIVNGQNGINDPRGMSGVRLEADVQIITGSATSVQNLIKSCQKAGLYVLDVVIDHMANATAVLNQEEKDIGVGLIDLGGGKTNITLFHEGNICYTSVLNVGGTNFTHDVAMGLRVTVSEAEKIKKDHGCTLISKVKKEEQIELIYPGERPSRLIPRQHLVEILQPRAEELMYLIKEDIVKSGFHGVLTSGVVLTGGTALIQGMDVLAENILELPVRIGNPKGFSGLKHSVCSPVYATGIGLVIHGAREAMAEGKFGNGSILTGMMTLMRGWAQVLFK
jgi:cell division protein FtsA